MFNYNPFSNHFGIDISDFKIRFFQILKTKKFQKIKTFGEISTVPGIIVNGEIKNVASVSNLIKEMLSHPQFGKIDTKYVVASLPDKKTYIKIFEIPSVPDNELAGAVQWGIEQNFPVEIDDVYIDWIKFGPATQKNNSSKQKILASVAPRDIVDSYTNVLISSGLVPIALENESFAIARSLLNENDYLLPKCIIDLGRSRTNFIVTFGGAVIYTSTIEVSGNTMTQKISESMKLTFDESEKAKIIYGLNRTKAHGQIFKIIEPLLSLLTLKISENIEYFNSTFTDKKINALYLTGSVSHMNGLNEYLRLQLNKKIVEGNPLTNLRRIETNKNIDLNKFNSYSTAIGLSLKEVKI